MGRNVLFGAFLGAFTGLVSSLQAADTVYAQSALLMQSGRAYFTSEGKGTVTAASDGWFVYTPSALSDDTTVTLMVEMTNVTYRTFNQFWIEVDNQNSAHVALQFVLGRALPVWDEVKTTVQEFASGKCEVVKVIESLGTPSKLRYVQMKVQHKTATYPQSAVTKPIRFRARLRLTDYKLQTLLWDKLPASLATALPAGLSEAAKKAGEAKRTELKNAVASLKTKAQTSTTDRIANYEALFDYKDRAGRMIQQAALLVDARSAEAKGAYLYGVISGADKVSRDDVFTGTVNGALEVSAARGEAEGVQAALYSTVAQAGVKATVSALTAADGTRLDPGYVTVHPVGFVKPTYPAYVSPARFRETVADPILEWTDTADLEAERFQPYWIEADIPEGTKPGLYAGTVVFAGATGPSVAVPLTVKVRQMTLARHRRLPVIFSSSVYSAKSSVQITYEQDESVLDELATFLSSEGGNPSVLSTGARAAWDRMEQEHRLLVSHNIPIQGIYSSPSVIQPKWIRDIRLQECPAIFTIGYDKVSPSVDVVGKHVAAMGEKSSAIWFYGYDEVSSADAFAGMKKSFGSVKAAYPQVKTFCSALDGTYGEKSDCLEEVDAWIDPEDRYSGHSAAAEKARARGKQAWYYPCNWPIIPYANFHLENTAVASRALMGLAAWKKKTDGVLYYSVDTFTPYVDTPILSYGFNTFSGGAKKTRLGNNGYDVDVTITTSSSSTSGKAERWESFADDIDRLPPVRIRGDVYVDSFTKSSGCGCNVELRFNYKDKTLGTNGQEQNFYNVDVGKTKVWQTIDLTVTPKGEAVNCLFRVYAKSSKAKVVFRNLRVEAADGHLANRKLGVAEPLPENTVVFENACYGCFRSNGDGSLLYPGPKGPSSSIRLKCVRDGIDDYEYLYRLDNAVLAVKAGLVEVDDKEDFLSRAAAVLSVPSDVCESFTTYAAEGSALVAWRDVAGELLDEYIEAEEASREEEDLVSGIFDSFETFAGASGTTAGGFAGDDGKSEPWTTTGAVIVEDGTAFHGKKYLRLADNDGSQHNATKSFPVLQRIPFSDGDIPISFAFRRSDAPDQTTGLTGCNFSFFGASESLSSKKSSPNKDLFANPTATWEETEVRSDRWYYLEGRLRKEGYYDENGDAKVRLVFYVDRLTDTVTREALPGVDGETPYSSVNVNSAEDWALQRLYFFTWGASRGYVDIDAIRIGPGPSPTLYEALRTFGGASGTSVAGFNGDDRRTSWTASGSVVVSDGSGFDGDAFLRLADADAKQHTAEMRFADGQAPCFPLVASEGLPFSFAFRRQAWSNQTASATMTGCNFRFSGRSDVLGKTVNTADANLFATPAAAWTDGVVTGRWYLVEGRLVNEPFVNNSGADQNRLAFRAERVIDTEAGTVLAEGESLSKAYTTVNADPATDWCLSALRFMTWSTGEGWVDIDAIRLGSAAQKCQAGRFLESFETFPRACGTSIAGYRGDDGAGKWSAGGCAIIVAEGESSFLRINDDTTSQHSVTKSILPAYRPTVPKPGQRRCAFSFSFRRTPAGDPSAALTGCKLKLTAVSLTTGESIAYTDGVDLFQTPAAIKTQLSDTGVWYRVTGHLRLETPFAGRRRLALRVTAVDNLDTGARLYAAAGEGMLYSYKDLTTETDDFALSGFTFFTYGASKGLIDFDDFVIGSRDARGFSVEIR